METDRVSRYVLEKRKKERSRQYCLASSRLYTKVKAHAQTQRSRGRLALGKLHLKPRLCTSPLYPLHLPRWHRRHGGLGPASRPTQRPPRAKNKPMPCGWFRAAVVRIGAPNIQHPDRMEPRTDEHRCSMQGGSIGQQGSGRAHVLSRVLVPFRIWDGRLRDLARGGQRLGESQPSHLVLATETNKTLSCPTHRIL
jgi:hypothetical protein